MPSAVGNTTKLVTLDILYSILNYYNMLLKLGWKYISNLSFVIKQVKSDQSAYVMLRMKFNKQLNKKPYVFAFIFYPDLIQVTNDTLLHWISEVY